MEKALVDEFIRDFKTLLGPTDGHLNDLASRRGEAARETAEILFRAYHSLKGGAAVLGIEPMRVLAERLEKIMAEVGEGERSAHPALIEAMRVATKRLSDMADFPDKAAELSIRDELDGLDKAERKASLPSDPSFPQRLDLTRYGISPAGVDRILAKHAYIHILTYAPKDFAPATGLKLQDLTAALTRQGEILASRFREGDAREFEVIYATSLDCAGLESLTRLSGERVALAASREAPAAAPAAPPSRPETGQTPVSQEIYGQIMLHANEMLEIARRLKVTEKDLDGRTLDMFAHLADAARHVMDTVSLKPEADGLPEHQRAGELPDHEPEAAKPRLPQEPGQAKHINVMLRDQEHAMQIADQLSNFGYAVGTFAGCETLSQALEDDTGHPAAVIVDLDACGPDDTCKLLREKNAAQAPIIFVSDRDDLDTRIKALRSGGVAYFTTPLDLVALVEKIDKLTDVADTDPYRVMIVDDQPGIAGYHESILKNNGMRTSVVTDPLQVLDRLTDFSPELILMDVYMPGCTGVEIANVIRQKEEYVSIPIVYLSSESDIRKQMHAMSIGGDDFLTKPIRPDHLVASVASRAERYRILRSFMERDGMTGLLNHTNITERIQSEMSRAARYDDIFALAMLDIDKFKSVNDKYGHSTGDRVIKSLSRLLQQRLRRTDIIGRYGGEEFSVILINTDGEEGVKVFDALRQAFSQIEHQYHDENFKVTFSCGIAVFNKDMDAKQLIDKADQALYEAKHAGRNRVVLAGD